MFLHFFKKELLRSFLNHKFYIGFILIFLVLPISIFLKNTEYNRKSEIYNVSVKNWINIPERPFHHDIEISLYRAPSPLSIFCRETGEPLGNKFSTSGIGSSFEVSNYTQNSSIFNKFKKIDPFLITSFLLSLFALLFTYDLVAGERESGTIELQFSYSVTKHDVILGKYLSSFLLIFSAFISSFFISILFLIFQDNFFINFEDWIRLFLVLLSTLLLISLFCWVGLFFSVFNKRSSTALMSCIFLWIFLGIIYPNLSQWMGKVLLPIKHLPGKKVYVFNPNDPGEIEELELSNKRTLAFINQIIQQYYTSRVLSYLSPLDFFQHSCSSFLGEDPDAYNHFLEQALNYNEQLKSWQKKMIKEYSLFRPVKGGEKIDLTGLPLYNFKRKRLSSSIPRFFKDISILIFYNFLFFICTYVGFLKYDPRFLRT